MEGQLGNLFELDMELELTEVDFYGLSGSFVHCYAPAGFLKDEEF
jgi:hypothetical protein